MTNFEKGSVLVLRDQSIGLISVACESCETITTHTCVYSWDEGETRPSRYEVERDTFDRVWVLTCKDCGIVDLTPFIEDTFSSQNLHDSLHDFANDLMAASGIEAPMTAPWDFYEEFMDVLRADDEMAEMAREHRCLSWSRYVNN